MDYFKQAELDKWKSDLEIYYSYKKIFDRFCSERAKLKMEEIKNRWPNHQDCFE